MEKRKQNIRDAREALGRLRLIAESTCQQELDKVVRQFQGNFSFSRDAQNRIVFDRNEFLRIEQRINHELGFPMSRKDLHDLVRNSDAIFAIGALSRREVPSGIDEIVNGLALRINHFEEELYASVEKSRKEKDKVRDRATTRVRKAILGTALLTANGGAVLCDMCESSHAGISMGMGAKYWADAVGGV